MMELRQGLYYLAHCYTTKNSKGDYVHEGEVANFNLCCIRAAKLIEAGWNIYAPICHTHPIHCAWPNFVGKEVHEMWYSYDEIFIRHANFTGIILSPGWEASKGCCGEKKLFEELGREVLYYCNGAVSAAGKIKQDDIIEDGYGGAWSIVCCMCGARTMQVVRPGKVQCSMCG